MQDLATVQNAFKTSGDAGVKAVRDKIETLVNDQPQEAADFFLSVINLEYPSWTQQALRYFSGYKSDRISELQSKMREVLSNQNYLENFRIRAADILGDIVEKRDGVLVSAIKADPDPTVKATAFGALIRSETDYWTSKDAFNRADSGELEPTLENAEKIIAEWKTQNQNA
jgi:hypothetical protein